jgi:hypothetical protein
VSSQLLVVPTLPVLLAQDQACQKRAQLAISTPISSRRDLNEMARSRSSTNLTQTVLCWQWS